MKRLLLALAASTLLATSAEAAKVGVSMAQFDDNFLTVLRNGIERLRQDASRRRHCRSRTRRTTSASSSTRSRTSSPQKVDAIIVNPVDTDATPQMTKLAADAGIPLVYVNRHAGRRRQLPAKVAFVGFEREASPARCETKEVCRCCGGKGDIVVMMGELSNQAARQRTQDVHDVIATPECTGIKILDEQTANWERTEAHDLMTNWLSAGLKPDAVVSNNDEMAIGAIQAMKAGRLGHEARSSSAASTRRRTRSPR